MPPTDLVRDAVNAVGFVLRGADDARSEALRDRIDVIVQALAFNPRFLGELLTRIEEDARPEEFVPREIIFNDDYASMLAAQRSHTIDNRFG